MPSGPADHPTQSGHRRWWPVVVLLSLLLLLLTAGGLVVVRQGRGGPADARPGSLPTRRATDSSVVRDAGAATVVARLSRGLRSGTAGEVAALAAPADPRASHELRVLHRNVRSLRLGDLALRYLGDGAARLSTEQERALAPGAWVGDVELRWRLRGFDAHASVRVLPFTFRTVGPRTTLVTARRSYGAAVPLWLLGPVQVTRMPRSLVVTTRAGRPAAVSALAEQAVRQVRRVLRSWRGRLVVEVPPHRRTLARVLGARPGTYRDIAAVTTTSDGSHDGGAPEHILLDPPVFDRLGPNGSQIVMSHEATHVATGAAVSALPPWLVEGFADYVALRDLDLPVSVTAGQVLARVRRSGPPRRLPGRSSFEAGTAGLGSSYEAAWLACRLLARTYGERRLVAFYRAADAAGSTTAPFRTVLGTDERAFTRAWRADLRRLAR